MNYKEIVNSEEDTAKIAKKFATLLKNKVILLNGCLGAGKTTFIKYLTIELGFPDITYSPTFSIVNRYILGENALNHLDLYRLENEFELEMIDFYDILKQDETVVIEWAEKFNFKKSLKQYVEIFININSDGSRTFDITFY